MIIRFSFLAPALILSLFAAGCGSSRPTSSPTSLSPTGGTPSFMGGEDQASKVPSDIPVYPGGTVLLVSGGAGEISVAQSTPDTGSKVIDWIKQEYARRGATLKKTDLSPQGGSTVLHFELNGHRYDARVDAPADGGAYLTIQRDGSLGL